jgi:hypothetical protein
MDAAGAACGTPAAGGGADLVGDVLRELLEPVGDADLGLGHEVERAELECAQRHLGAALGERGDHHHRHRAKAHQARQEVEPVHAWHLDIQCDDVRVEAADHFARHQRVGGRADTFHVGLAVDDLAEQAAHQR